MNGLLSTFFDAALLTLRAPRTAAATVLRWPLPDAAIWPLVALSVVLSTLAAEFNSAMNPPPPGVPSMYIPPFGLAVLLAAANVTMAAAMSATGRMFGGQGGFRAALILTTWQQLVWFGALFGLTFLGLLLPSIASMLALGFGIYMIWVLICFASVLHGFPTMLGLVTLVMSSVAAAVVMIVLMGVLGVSIGEGAL